MQSIGYCKLGKAQNLSIKEQLEARIRYLDLQLLKNPETQTYWTVHALCGEPLEQILLHVVALLLQIL